MGLDSVKATETISESTNVELNSDLSNLTSQLLKQVEVSESKNVMFIF